MEKHGYEVLWSAEKLYTSKAKAMRSSAATRFFAATNFAATFNRIAPSPTCWDASSFQVELVDARFYHLDTCFCPLPDGGAIWFSAAFDEYGQRAIRGHLADLVEVEEEEANNFAAMPSCSIVTSSCEGAPKLSEANESRLSLSSVADVRISQGRGACKCLTMFMPQRL